MQVRIVSCETKSVFALSVEFSELMRPQQEGTSMNDLRVGRTLDNASSLCEFNWKVCRMTVYVVALIVISTVLVSAQVNSTGTISGRVTDSQGDVLSGAAVTIVEQLTNVETKLTTNNSGFYSAGFLKPGTYSIKISATGFDSALSSG